MFLVMFPMFLETATEPPTRLMSQVDDIKLNQTTIRRIPSRLAKLLESPACRMGCIASFALETAMRRSEIAKLEWPDALPSAALQRLDKYCAWRLRTDDDVPWVTIPKALKGIDELLPTFLAEPKRLLEDYRSALTSLEMNPIQRSR